jgi:tetratricopeptide (TPR) repeat protein
MMRASAFWMLWYMSKPKLDYNQSMALDQVDPLSPEAIRTLRGALSRAAFAAKVGVTAQTVYRWELPPDAKEARRPRTHDRARLLGMQGREGGEAAVDRDGTAALPAFEQILRGDWRRGEAELLQLLSAEVAPTRCAGALASVGLALVEATQRGSARRALSALTPALRTESTEELPRRIALWVHATAALVHSLPDGQLFDLGRVHVRVARVEEGAAEGEDLDAQFLSTVATMQAALFAGDEQLVQRAIGRGQLFERESLAPLMALHLDELRGFALLFAGQSVQAAARFEEVADRARELSASLVEARALSYVALRRLEDLADPEQAIATAKRALEVADRARIAPSVHTVFCARALVESYLRLGRMDDARAAMAGADAYSEETRMPPNVAVPALSRYYALRGDGEGMANLRAKLLAWDNPTMQPMTRAYASFVEAKRLFTMSDDMDAVVAAFADAETAAGRWPFLMKEILLFRTAVLVLAGRTDEARLHMRRTSRMLDHAPSPWAAAHLLRTEAILLAFQGDWVHGRKLIEAAIATFQMANDLPDALLARYTRACIDTFHEEPGGREDRDAVEAELLTAGIVPPLAARVGTAVLRDLRRGASLPPAPARVDVESLVVPLKRLAVRGSAPALVLRELFVLARTLVPRRPARLEEVDSNGRSETLHVDSAELPPDVYEWLEFGDGMGRRFRLGVQGPLESEEVSALSVITVTAALVLEVAGLRGLGKSVDGAGKEDASPDIPGLIAVSKAMRRVRAEISQLAGSRATIIVTGESGSGKEVVARAIHDTSARSAKPYVAFNCAAVPRELFEGQLFGYKRGAFTGAVSDHPGVIRAANGGTLFLDEVGELPLDVQPKLLRFLENGEVFPLGDRRAAQVDVRIVAATHRDLAELVKHGRFREDLYYRLQVVPLRIPPLRERKEDILPLARHFLRLLSPETKIPALASDAIEELTAYAWPGNVRELRNVLERALAFAPVPDVLRREHLRI